MTGASTDPHSTCISGSFFNQRHTHTHHFIDQQHSSQSLALILAPNLSTTCPRDGNFIFPSYPNTCIHILITCTNTSYPFPGSILLSRWSPSNWKQCAPKHADVARVPYQRSFSGLFYQNIKALSLLFQMFLLSCFYLVWGGKAV